MIASAEMETGKQRGKTGKENGKREPENERGKWDMRRCGAGRRRASPFFFGGKPCGAGTACAEDQRRTGNGPRGKDYAAGECAGDGRGRSGEGGMPVEERTRGDVLEAYFRERKEPGEIAAQFGIEESAVLAALNDPEMLEPYRQKAEAARLRAQICLYESAEAAARMQAQWLYADDGTGKASVSQKAAKEILDRTGVKGGKEERSGITLRLVGDVPKLGMPREAEDGGGAAETPREAGGAPMGGEGTDDAAQERSGRGKAAAKKARR